MRLTVSHGPAHGHMLDSRYSSEHRSHHMVPSPRTLKHRKRLPICIVDRCLLKLSVDVLRQYSLPNMDLRIATYLIIALPPKHNNIWTSPFQLPHVWCSRRISSERRQSAFFFTCVVTLMSKFIFTFIFVSIFMSCSCSSSPVCSCAYPTSESPQCSSSCSLSCSSRRCDIY
jgi:hypothetical protein